ncbi:NAD(P)-binding domain-containing protein [Streptomyces sp. NPDC058642]|uniref:NAD(P)-binding domain-containing protein n=1 Tax=Streptomyces sp. NPDC058642 TaxID=3346572 RepID=UPI003664A620
MCPHARTLPRPQTTRSAGAGAPRSAAPEGTSMNHTLGIIGSGNIGGAVARLAVNAGIDVVLSNSRGPETLRALADRLGPRARAATPAEAAAAGDWTVVAVPFSAVPHLPADASSTRTTTTACGTASSPNWRQVA